LRTRLEHGALTLALGLLLVFLATFPITYPYLTSLLTQNYGTEPNAIDLSTVQDVPLSPYVLLEYAGVALQSAQAGNFTQAQIVLGYISHLPPNIEHNLRTYLTQIAELVSIIRSLKGGLDSLKGLIDNGQIALAQQRIPQIESMLSDASSRLELLYSALDRAAIIYRIDVSRQRGHLDGLSSMLTQFRQILESLKEMLQALDKRTATTLAISASPNPVWVNGTLLIAGMLKLSNQTSLGGRVVEIWINGIKASEVRLDSDGRFEWKCNVSEHRFYTLEVYARYVPVGEDANRLRPAKSEMVTVTVNFYPVILTATISPNRVHVLESFLVRGRLTNGVKQPLANETVQLLIDGKYANNSDTDASGSYVMAGSFQTGSIEGNHTLFVEFSPLLGIYAPTQISPQLGIYESTQSRNLGLQLYYVRSSVNVTSGESTFALSGQTVSLGGIVTASAKPFSQGLIVALLGERELGRVPVGEDGTFTIPLSIPIDVSGMSAITITFVPETPWVISNGTSVTLNVMNSGLIGFASIAFVASVVTLSTRTIQVSSPSRHRRKEDEQTLVEKLRAEAKTVPPSTTMHLARLKGLRDPRSCVQETYWEIRHVLVEVLHQEEQSSETPREFAAKINPKLADAATPFSLLTLLFEVAEYSEHEISWQRADVAVNYAVLVAEALNVPVKRDETWQQFREEYETKTNEILHQLGISALGIAISATSVSVQIPWFLSDATQLLVSKALQEALRMPINLILVRFCDKCRYKLEGSAVKLGICPECGRRLETSGH